MAHLPPSYDLSSEARRALALVAAGFGTRAISERLGCDRAALHLLLADTVRRLSARSVSEAVRIAVDRSLIEPPR